MSDFHCLESPAPDTSSWRSVHSPSATGTTAINAMINSLMGPELIIGALDTNQSTLAIDNIISQDTYYCIYVRFGQKTLQSLTPNCNKFL